MQKPLAAAIAALFAPLVSAQQIQAEPPTPVPARPPATVEVKASLDTQRREDSASRTVVGHDELVKYGDATVLDALKRLPGVTVGNGGVRMRGLGNGYTQVLVNGERMPPGFDLEALSPEAIEKIEIIRAATAEYSTAAIAGTVNIVLRKAIAKDAAELKLSHGGGAGYRLDSVTAAKSSKGPSFGYTLTALLNDWARGYRERETVADIAPGGMLGALRIADTGYDQHFTSGNLNARLNWTLGGGDSLSWQSFYNGGYSRGTEDNRTAALAGPAYPYPLLPAAWEVRSAALHSELGLEKRLGQGKLDARLVLDASRMNRSLARQGIRDGALVLDRGDASKLRDWDLNSTGKYKVPLLEGHAFAFGWNGGHERQRQREFHTQGALDGAEAVDLDTPFTATVDRLAVYGQDEWDVRPGWSVYLGARWEGVRTATSGEGFAAAASRYSVFSPLLQTLWKIPGSKQDQLRLALTRTYRAPRMFELVPSRFITSFNSEVSPDYIGNPDLRPELATGLDAAYEHYFSGGGMVSLSATSRSIRDLIRSETRSESDSKGARWLRTPVNQGHAQVRSLALETKLPLKALGLAWPVELRANVSRNWSSVDAVPGPGNRLDSQPRWSANLGADYSGAALSAGASFNFVSGGWTRSSVSESSYGGAARDLEAYALYKIDPRRQLRFTVRNLLATDQLRGSRYTDPLGVTERASFTPTSRSWRLQYEQKFQ
ncbi:Colicin I receptor [Massilia sp. Bi118]|uniref:TonB-dependent receptor plug domain-containing protein n=1 Tax=Massilia sp. Bi118 TaxID=2822346 RepID=UPI001D8AC3CF|nr:TonB-dependent receptor [Massilia sp. Bi118]CAH0172940.1 Colicin I receptor [Massilia sp. Bi118]